MVSRGEDSRRKSRCEDRELAVCLVRTRDQGGGQCGSRMGWGRRQSGGEVPRKAGVPMGHGGHCGIRSRAMPQPGVHFKGILAACHLPNKPGGAKTESAGLVRRGIVVIQVAGVGLCWVAASRRDTQ